MESIRIGDWIQVQSYKHDGSLHRTWDNAMVVENNPDYIVIVSNINKVIESDGRRWFTKEPAVSIFFYHEWFNVIAMFKDDHKLYYYCNIASPSLIHNHIVKYIDYDLDLKLLPNHEIMELDLKEYEFHAAKYHYSSDIDKICRVTFAEVKKMMQNKIFPFNTEKIKDLYDKFVSLKEQQDHGIHY